MIIKYRQPIKGLHLDITMSKDDTFGKLLLGNGFLIQPNDNNCYSPIDGTIILIHPSKHYIVIKDYYNNHILIHIGIGTVGLNGICFNLIKNVNEKVKTGDLLLTFDTDFILKNNLSLDTFVVFMEKKVIKILSSNLIDEIYFLDIEVS